MPESSEFVSRWNILAEHKRAADQFFFVVEGIYEKIAEDITVGLQAACEAALPVLREYTRTERTVFQLEDRLGCSTPQERAAEEASITRLVSSICLVLQAGASGAPAGHLRQLEAVLARDNRAFSKVSCQEVYPDAESGLG